MTSRRDRTPTWAELVVRASVADARALRATYRREAGIRSGGFIFGSSHRHPVVASVPTGRDVRVTYVFPDRWRLDDDDGLLWLLDGRECYLRQDDGSMGLLPRRRLVQVHGPEALVHPELDRVFGSSPGSGPSASAEPVHGRPAWRVQQSGLSLWIDDETGFLLRESDQHGAVAELRDLDLTPAVSEEEFQPPPWVVPVPEPAPDPEHERARARSLRSAEPPDLLPTLTWWPDGLRGEVAEVDLETGAYVLRYRAGGHELLWLARGPRGAGRDLREPVQHRWSDDRWDYVLAASSRAAPADLARVVAEAEWGDDS